MTTVSQEPRYVIYGLHCTCNPERGIRYVGQTVRGAPARLRQHTHSARSGSELPVHRWIRKHSWERVEIIELAVTNDIDICNLLEEVLISSYRRDAGRGLLNVKDGGYSNRGYKPPAELVESIRRTKLSKGYKHTDSWRKNMSERVAGEGNPAAKLNWEIVNRCRSKYASGVWPQDIQREEGISEQMLLYVIQNKNWYDPNWIRPTPEELSVARTELPPHRRYVRHASPISTEEALEIRDLARDGVKQSEIAAKYRCDQSTVSRIVTGSRSWSKLDAGQPTPAAHNPKKTRNPQ